MAFYDEDDHQGDAAPPRARGYARRVMTLVGIAGSLALLGWGGVWGYRAAVRSVVGIPLITADPAPMREAPDDPRGTQTAHQGLSVNDVAAFGVAAPLPDEIVLAPRASGLDPVEDVPGLSPEPPPALVGESVAQGPSQPLLPLSETLPPAAVASIAPGMQADPTADLPLDPSAAPAVIPPSTDAPAQTATPEDPAATAVVAALAEAAATPAESEPEIPAEVVPGGMGRSLLPRARPAAMAAALAEARASNAPVTVRAVDPASLAPGTRLVQFGAFASEAEAQDHWQRLAETFGELLAGKGQVVQAAESGGRTFYRLRAEGFTDDADARRFCAAITAVGPECIPVAVR